MRMARNPPLYNVGRYSGHRLLDVRGASVTPGLSRWCNLEDSLDVQVSESTLPHGYVLAFSTARTFCMTTTSLPSYLGERIFSHPMGA
jgi:hypothetical protein